MKAKIFVLLLLLFLMNSCGHVVTGPQGIFDIDRIYFWHTRRHASNRDLFDAVRRNDVDGVREALGTRRRGANPNVADNLGQSALMWASWNGMSDIVELLLSSRRNVNINRPSRNGYTALLCAAHVGRIDIYRMLINAGADTQARDRNGETVLHKAIRSGNLELVRFILDSDGSDNNPDRNSLIDRPDSLYFTPLHFAVLTGNGRMVNLLLEHGADSFFPARGPNGQNIYPLYSAFHLRQYGVYVSLLKNLQTDQVNAIFASAFEAIRERVERLEQFGAQGRIGDHLDKYVFSLSRRMRNERYIEDTAFQDLVEQFYAAVRYGNYHDVRTSGDRVFRDIDRYAPRSSDSSEDNFIRTAIMRDNLEILEYLLWHDFRTTDASDPLIHAAMRANVTGNFGILDRLIHYLQLDYFPAAIRLSVPINGEHALRHIARNERYLIERGWGALQPLFQLYGDRLRPRISGTTWILSDIVRLGRYSELNESEKNRLMEVRDRMFDFVFNNIIYPTPNMQSGGESRSIFEYLVRNEYFRGANRLLFYPRTRRIVEEVLWSRPYILEGLPANLYPRYATLVQLRAEVLE
ncbi:MAG: ankyrin repeat domain-containing protein [Treponema sp.]|nr:ankyrin repeat domain-containing protein [Treponema sp.]